MLPKSVFCSSLDLSFSWSWYSLYSLSPFDISLYSRSLASSFRALSRGICPCTSQWEICPVHDLLEGWLFSYQHPNIANKPEAKNIPSKTLPLCVFLISILHICSMPVTRPFSFFWIVFSIVLHLLSANACFTVGVFMPIEVHNAFDLTAGFACLRM